MKRKTKLMLLAFVLCPLLSAIGCGSSSPPWSSSGISTQSTTCEATCDDKNPCTDDKCFDDHCFNTNLPDGTACSVESWPTPGVCVTDGEGVSACKLPNPCLVGKPGEACPSGLCDAVGGCCSNGCLDTHSTCKVGGEQDEHGRCRVCFINSDCPASTIPDGVCGTVRCDPTGHKTEPGSPIEGCYVAPVPAETPCVVDGCLGSCFPPSGEIPGHCQHLTPCQDGGAP